MARNVFISFLGTNNYLQTRYQWEQEEPSKPVRFIQEAILSRIAKDWTENDRIFIFYTEGDQGSFKLNWKNNGHTRFNEGDEKDQELEKIGLEQRLHELGLKAEIKGLTIKEGFSEDEVWEVFNTVYGVLLPGDKIYFDITHAFRSIPLFASSLFNFAQYTKGTEVMSVNYGAFEKLGPVYKVKTMPIEERVAPVVDMTKIVRLQKLTETATSITEFGRIKKLSEVITSSNRDNEINDYIKNITTAISDLDEAIQTSRVKIIKEGKYFIKFNNYFKGAKNRSGMNRPLQVLLDKLKNELKNFVPGNDYKNVEAAIAWTYDHDMLAQAATLAQEYMISYTVDYVKKRGIKNPYLELKGEEKKKDPKTSFREFVGAILAIPEKDIKNKDFRGDLNVYDSLRATLLEIDLIKDIRKEYDTLREVRNSINHGKGDNSFEDMKKELDESYKKCLNVIHCYTL